MIAFGLEEEQQLIVSSVRDFARTELRERTRQIEKDGPSAALHAKYHEMGIPGIAYPDTVGGQGLGPIVAALAEEELGWGDAGAAVALDGVGLFGQALAVLGTEAQRQEHLAPLLGPKGAGQAGAFAWSEATLSRAPGLATSARREGGGWALTGRKRFVLHSDRARAVVVVAQIDADAGWNGLGAFVVPLQGLRGVVPLQGLRGVVPLQGPRDVDDRSAPGVRVGPRVGLVGLDAAPVHDVTLEDCRVADAARLPGPDGRPFLDGLREVLARGALVAAARMVGVARAAYEYALEYAQARHAFGKPIGHFQSIAFLLSEMAMDVESARWLLWRAAWRLDKKGIARAHRDLAMASAQAAEVAKRVTSNAVQVLGGAGFVRDHPVEKWMRDASALALLYGSVEQANSIVAADLLAAPDSPVDPADLLPGAGLQPIVT